MNPDAAHSQPELARPQVDKVLSGQQLEAAFRIADFHLDILRPLRAQLLDEIQRGIRPVYLLDFQELYSFMHPYSDRARDSVVISYFLEYTQIPLFLPDGTISELVTYLRRLASDSARTVRMTAGQAQLPQTAAYRRIAQIVERAKGDAPFDGLRGDRDRSSEALPELVGALHLHHRAAKRLADFFERAAFLSMNELFPSQDSPGLDQVAFNVSKRVLNAVRPGSEEANIADSLNIAQAAWMRENLPSMGYRPFLVTHTPALLRTGPWVQDEAARAHGIGPDLFRTHLSAFYSSVLERHSRDPRGRIKVVETAIDKCNRLQSTILQTPGFLEPADRHPPASFDSIWDLVDNYGQGLALSEDLQAFNSYFVDVFAKTVDSLLADSARRNVTLAEVYGRPASAERSRLELFEAVQRLEGVIQGILDMARRTAGERPREAKPREVDETRAYPGLNVFSVHPVEVVNPSTGTEKFQLLTRDGDLIAGLEIYTEGHYSCYWQTLVSLESFVKLVRYYEARLRAAARRGEIQADDRDSDPTREFTVIVGTQHRRLVSQSTLPIQLDALFGAVGLETDEVPTYLRVNTPHADFYVDIVGIEGEGEQITGVVTHQMPVSLLVQMFTESSRLHFWPQLLEMELEQRIRDRSDG